MNIGKEVNKSSTKEQTNQTQKGKQTNDSPIQKAKSQQTTKDLQTNIDCLNYQPREPCYSGS